jgi:hypothetical protein
MVRQGMAWLGKARQGMAWQGKSRQGMERQGVITEKLSATLHANG